MVCPAGRAAAASALSASTGSSSIGGRGGTAARLAVIVAGVLGAVVVVAALSWAAVHLARRLPCLLAAAAPWPFHAPPGKPSARLTWVLLMLQR